MKMETVILLNTLWKLFSAEIFLSNIKSVNPFLKSIKKKAFCLALKFFDPFSSVRFLPIIPILVLCAVQLNANETQRLRVKLEWHEAPQSIRLNETDTRIIPFFEGASLSQEKNFIPVFYQNINISQAGEIEAQIINAIYEPLELTGISLSDKDFSELIQVEAAIGYIKKRPVATVSFIPLRKNAFSGTIEKLVEFDIELKITAAPQTVAMKRASDYTDNSVLSSGKWYKVSVPREGIFKMDYNFLKNLGLDVDNLDPRNLRVYGNGGGMLPELNAAFRHDDLQENAIRVIGESDGKFNQNDYILFYGQSPHRWHYNATKQRFNHTYHLYTELTYYFITADPVQGAAAPKRWTSQASAGNPNVSVTTFDDFQFHELEEVNLIRSGREWYGDYFNFSATARNFSFTFPNIVTNEQAYLRTNVAARSISANTNFSFSISGQPVNLHNINRVGNYYTDIYARPDEKEGVFNVFGDQITVTANFSNPSSGAEGWLNFIELNVRRRLVYTGSPLFFRDINSVGIGNRSEFTVQNVPSNILILDVTNQLNAFQIEHQLSGNELKFSAATDSLREFVAFVDGSGLLTPQAIGRVDNQNLHATTQPDMIIITPASLKNESETLANHHRNNNNLDVITVDVQHIYNEFSSGAQDLSAIRDFVRMVYVREGSDTDLMPKYLLLFGDGSFDYKDKVSNNNNLVPTYQSPNSTSPVETFASDDFFGFLDDNEGNMFISKMDIAIGRLPVTNATEALNMVNKIIHYQSNNVFGNWRNYLCFVGDDEDGNIHMDQANRLAQYFENNHRVYNIDKIFLDAYPQQSTPGGSRYPDVNDAIDRRMFAGALIMNYTGHGGVNGWAHERILDIPMINAWENFDKMPLFVTATCEFSRFDDPGKLSAGEIVLLNPNGGAWAMVTTTRLVYSGANFSLNNNFLQQAFTPLTGRMPTVGEAVMETKNKIALDANNRKFILLGDPAIALAYPTYQVVTTAINGTSVQGDTLKALKKMTISGEVRDGNSNKMNNFNGIVYPTILDKPVQVTTLRNDGGAAFNFSTQRNVIYNGKASVSEGAFSYTFIVPKDIAYKIGDGKISYYSDNGQIDAQGYTTVKIGGTATDFDADKEGPEIDIFMNDEKFVFGGMTNENPLLLVKLRDESGINTVGTGIGHDITALLNDNTQDVFMLNEYYESELDNFQAGKVEYPLSSLEDGRHTIKVKAWDVHNNSSEGYTEFVVAKAADLALSHVLNYPNPFTTKTNFFFEHNRPGQPLSVTIRIMTVSGKVVKTIHEEVVSDGFRVDHISWDGLDEFGDIIGRGVYVYKLNVRSADGAAAHEFEKLVILR